MVFFFIIILYTYDLQKEETLLNKEIVGFAICNADKKNSMTVNKSLELAEKSVSRKECHGPKKPVN